MKIALLGIGTVGSGVFNLIKANQAAYQQLLGEPLEVTHVFTRNPEQPRPFDFTNVEVTDDIERIYAADVDIVVEVMGGVAFTRDIVLNCLRRGRHVVTANKDMLALHIEELMAVAREHHVTLMYEASVAGGIPIINGIEVGLASNELSDVMGILNGTTNYMLTRMTQDGWDYQRALNEAQTLGYAEADPTNDVGGFDAARKIALLTRLAFGTKVTFADVPVQGIETVEVQDIELAKAAGYVMKLIGSSRIVDAGVQVGVAPVFIPQAHPLAGVSQAYNAVYVKGDAIGQAMFWGPGAGSLETASAVVSDVLQVAQRGEIIHPSPTQHLPIVVGQVDQAYYLRFEQDPVHVRAVLQTLAIGYVSLAETSSGLVILTESIATDTFKQLSDNTQIAAQYAVL